MERDVESILLDREELSQICKNLGEQITKDYAGKKLLVVSVLKGAVVFMADLLREIKKKNSEKGKEYGIDLNIKKNTLIS